MKNKNRLIKIAAFFAFFLAFAVGQNAMAQSSSTFNNTIGDNLWSTAGNWSDGVPTASVDAVIADGETCEVDAGATRECLSLKIGWNDNDGGGAAIIRPQDGDTVTLNIYGNVTLNDSEDDNDAFLGRNGSGRLNVNFLDDAEIEISNGSSTYSLSRGLNFNDITITGKAVQYVGDTRMYSTGDLTLTGTSAFAAETNTSGTFVFYKAVAGETHAITVPSTGSVEFVNLEADGDVTTSSNITVRERLTVNSGDSFIASDGTVTIAPPAAAVAGYNNMGTLSFYNLKLGANYDITPISGGESCIITGDLSKTGSGRFVPAAGTITFTNSTAKSITRNGTGPLSFYDMTISSGASIVSTSSMTLSNDMTANGSFSQTSNTFFLWGTDVDLIKGSLGSIALNHVHVENATTSVSAYDVTIGGHLQVDASTTFTGDPAQSSNITMQNTNERQIINNGNLNFYTLTVPSGSQVTTASSMTITGDGTDDGEISVEGSLTQTSGTVTFSGADTKSITNTGTLQLYDVVIEGTAGNDVTTTSDFTLAGTYFDCQLNASFNADDGIITCTNGSGATFTAGTDGNLMPHSITAEDVIVAVTLGDQINISGDITVNGSSGSFSTFDNTGTVELDGTGVQNITGDGNAGNNAVMIGILTVNNTAGTSSDVALGIDVKVFDGGTLTLTDGVVDLGTNTLSVGGTVSYTNGTIYGNAGTYEIFGTHVSGDFEDALFTPDSDPTLYNLLVTSADGLDGNLTVNGDLTLNATLDLDASELEVYGDISQGDAANKMDATDGDSKLILSGTGTVEDFSNIYFTGGSIQNLQINRPETLADDLTVVGIFTLNTGVQYFDIDQYKLDLAGSIQLISGSVTAGTLSKVDFDDNTEIPANFFTDNTAYDVELNEEVTLGSDLTILGTLSYTGAAVQNLYTGDDNTLTFGPSATLPTFTTTDHIIGNMKRTVTNALTSFPIGGGPATTYRPISMQFETAGSSQVVKVSSEIINPTYGRAGDPENAVQIAWTVTPEGTAPSDDMKVRLEWNTAYDGDTPPAANKTFAARWDGTEWDSYYDYASYTVPVDRQLAMSDFAVSASELEGTWAAFTADEATSTSAAEALTSDVYKLVFTEVTPNPATSGNNFSVTIQLQDENGDPVTATKAYTVNVSTHLGTALDAPATRESDIEIGSNSVIFSNLSIPNASGESGIQLLATTATTDPSGDAVQAGVSEQISLIGDDPTDQASGIAFSNVAATTVDVSWTAPATADPVVLIARAVSTIDTHPSDGTTYVANSIYGAGSSVGDAVVLYKGTGTSVKVTGLAPSTDYYFSVYAYTGSAGNENYLTDPGVSNFNQLTTTTGTTDDDAEFGSNDTRLTAAPIGTNTPVKGRISSSTDEDWFSFTITNASPNVRGRIYTLPKNYNIEFYDSDGNRIRRAIRPGTNNEAFVVNYLDAGTYTVRVYGVDGANDTENYTLLITTMSTEIFSVTP
ncbi:MAG: beta strand repeat-containing protein [Candidatus Kapaibacterium sp.]